MEISRLSALTELASGIAHEINQPLGAIATFAQAGERMLNRKEPLVEETLDVLRQITDAALSAGEGIRRIRRLFDQDSSVRSSCQISELIDELEPVLELFASRVGGQLHIDITPGVPAVMADRLRIQHVLVALVQNAWDASALCEGVPKITVSDEQRSIYGGDQRPGFGSRGTGRAFNVSCFGLSLRPNNAVRAWVWPRVGP